MTKQEVLNTIRDFSDSFPREALREIQSNRESYIPELLASLDYVYHNAKKLHVEDCDYFLHAYAMYLLAEFKEKGAFRLLVNLLRLPQDQVEFFLGDCLTGDFPRFLFCTFDSENIQILLDVIEDHELYEWARLSAVTAYKLLVKNGIVSKTESVSYLRSLIYDKLSPDDSYEVFTGIVGCVIHAKLFDMIPDVRFLYDDERVDGSMYGGYDSFIDWIFYKEQSETPYIDDTISEMESWACFESKGNSNRNLRETGDIFEELKKDIELEKMIDKKSKKTGRNDPCPCGSGKKYKKCCIDAERNDTSVTRLEDRFDLLDRYPKNSPLFEQMFEKEAVDIDMLVYKALHHRAIPLWIERDLQQERIGIIHYLNEALTLFLDKCQQEQISSFSAYDEKYLVHYRSKEWVSSLIKLTDDDDSARIVTINRTAKDVFRRFL